MQKFIRIELVDTQEGIDKAISDIDSGVISEHNFIEIQGNEKLKTDVSISQKTVDDCIQDIYIGTIGNKTTLVRAVLINGFEIIETSSCVDEKNYDEKIGAEVCIKKIKDKVWYLLGFMLQSAVSNK